MLRISALIVIVAGCSGGGNGGPVSGTSGPFFETPMFFDRDVSASPKASDSDTLIAALTAAGGWGNGNKFQIDFSMDVLTAEASTPHVAFTPTTDFYTPDCDHVDVPVPPGGN